MDRSNAQHRPFQQPPDGDETDKDDVEKTPEVPPRPSEDDDDDTA